MSRKPFLWISTVLLLVLTAVAVWRYWPSPPLEIPRPSDLESLDARLVQQIEMGCDNVRQDPEVPATWGELGMVYHANGMPDLAISCYERARELAPQDAHWVYYSAMACKELGQIEDMLRLLNEVIALKSDFAPAYWRRGLILLDRADFTNAEQEFRRAVEIDPRDPSGWRGLARALLQQDRPDDAIEVLRQWLGTGAQDAYAHWLLGRAYRAAGQMELAEAEFRESGDVDPVWQDAWMFEVVQYGSNPGVLIKEARHCVEQGQHERAIEILQPVAASYPDDISVLNTLSSAYLHVQAFEAAIGLARESARLQPQHYEAHLLLGTAYLRQGDLAAALPAIDRAIACNPSSGDAYELRGLLLVEENKSEEAIAMFQRAEECEPNDPRFQYRIAMVHCRAKNWQQAVDVFEPVVEKNPTFVPGLIGMAMACIELHEFDRAQSLLERARSRDPRDPSLQYAERRMAQVKAEQKTGQ